MKPSALALFLLCLSTGIAQGLIIPQIVDGGGWQTTIVLTNASATPASANLSFVQEVGASNTLGWTPVFLETSTPQNLTLPGAGTLFLHTAGTAATTAVGWATLQANSSVSAFAIFTQRVPGRTDQDGTAVAAAASNRVLIPYDNTNGFVTSIALANTSASTEIVTVGLQPTAGSISRPTSITLPLQGHTSFAMPQQFPTSAGQSGLLEFYCSTGTISALALRFNPTGGFTAAPAYPQSGPPIVGSSGAGNVTLPQFTTITVSGTISVEHSAAPVGFVATMYNYGSNGYTVGSFSSTTVQLAVPSIFGFDASFGTVGISGLTFSFSNLQFGSSSFIEDIQGHLYGITVGSVTLVLTPSVTPAMGNATGSFSLTSSLTTLTGTITGTYSGNN